MTAMTKYKLKRVKSKPNVKALLSRTSPQMYDPFQRQISLASRSDRSKKLSRLTETALRKARLFLETVINYLSSGKVHLSSVIFLPSLIKLLTPKSFLRNTYSKPFIFNNGLLDDYTIY